MSEIVFPITLVNVSILPGAVSNSFSEPITTQTTIKLPWINSTELILSLYHDLIQLRKLQGRYIIKSHALDKSLVALQLMSKIEILRLERQLVPTLIEPIRVVACWVQLLLVPWVNRLCNGWWSVVVIDNRCKLLLLNFTMIVLNFVSREFRRVDQGLVDVFF